MYIKSISKNSRTPFIFLLGTLLKNIYRLKDQKLHPITLYKVHVQLRSFAKLYATKDRGTTKIKSKETIFENIKSNMLQFCLRLL